MESRKTIWKEIIDNGDIINKEPQNSEPCKKIISPPLQKLKDKLSEEEFMTIKNLI